MVAAAVDPTEELKVLPRVLLRAQRLREIGLSDLGLLAGGEGFDGEDAGGEFVFAEDDDVAGDAVGGLEGFLEAEAAVAEFDGEAGATEFAGQGEGGGVAFGPSGAM